jgi:KaiC/GvpD/RAD55 family RecA-like ATPase
VPSSAKQLSAILELEEANTPRPSARNASSMKNVTTALKKMALDDSLPEGLLILYGSSGSGKTVFAEQYAHETLEAGGKVYWITTEELPTTLRMNMERFQWPIEKFEIDGRMQIVDAISSTRLGLSEDLGRGLLGLDPTGMLIAITEQLRKIDTPEASSKFLVIVDSLSRLLLSCETKSVIDFASSLSSRLENYRTSGLTTIADSAHDEKVLNALTFSCTGAIRLRISDVDDSSRVKQMRIETLRGRRHDDAWKRYQISGEGLDIEI